MHPNFLPPNLSVGKAWEFSPRIVRVESLKLVWESANLASRNCTIHRLVEGHQDPNPTQKPEQSVVELVNSSGKKSSPGEDKMVSKRAMTMD